MMISLGWDTGSTYLDLVDKVDKPQFGRVVRRKNLHCQSLGDDGNNSWKITVVTAEDVLVVRFYQIRQETVNKRSFVHILRDR